jgi:hypothetical protein
MGYLVALNTRPLSYPAHLRRQTSRRCRPSKSGRAPKRSTPWKVDHGDDTRRVFIIIFQARTWRRSAPSLRNTSQAGGPRRRRRRRRTSDDSPSLSGRSRDQGLRLSRQIDSEFQFPIILRFCFLSPPIDFSYQPNEKFGKLVVYAAALLRI